MPYCPACRAEYDAGYTVCSDCGAELVDSLPPEGEEPVAVLHASTPNEALVAEATLEAEGIPAFVMDDDPVFPRVGNIDGDSPDLDVVVPGELADRARRILESPPPSEEELETAAGFEPEPETA